ncbi:MAG: O-antigen ligase family protein, partial [Candidatus Peregrinibacteria bacterium]|nr:O-antigen ligase family protein [Candidatus Peregrinibacteria bacterium]
MSKPLSTQDIIRWLIYSLIVLIPSVYATGFESVFTVPKLTVFRVITLLIVAVWGLQVLSQGKIVYRKSPINKWILGYGVVLILTTITSTYFWTSFFGDQSRFLGLATMLNLLFLMGVVMVFFQNRHHVMSYTKISVWTSVVLSIYGLLQYKGLVGAESWSHDPTLRVFGTMGHSNHFGAYIAFHVMLLLGLLFIQKQNSQKMVYALAVIPMLLTILATASRGAFFSLMAALGIFTLGMIFRKWGWIKKQGKKVVGVGILAVIVLALFSGPIIQKVSELSLTQRTVSTIQFVQEGNVPDRVSWWFSVLAMTRDHPILGHGLATFHDVYNLYRRTDYRVPGDIQDTFTPETAHMEYLDIAATQGLLGLFMYLGLLFMWFRLLWKVMVSEESSLNAKILGLSFLCAGLVYFIQVLMS